MLCSFPQKLIQYTQKKIKLDLLSFPSSAGCTCSFSRRRRGGNLIESAFTLIFSFLSLSHPVSLLSKSLSHCAIRLFLSISLFPIVMFIFPTSCGRAHKTKQNTPAAKCCLLNLNAATPTHILYDCFSFDSSLLPPC
jgi:hypothetical protein